MQLPWDEHYREIVIPAWLAYLEAETRLTNAINAKNDEAGKRAGYDALREGGAATIYVHHFADVVMRARPDWLPPELRSPGSCVAGSAATARCCGRRNTRSFVGGADSEKFAIQWT